VSRAVAVRRRTEYEGYPRRVEYELTPAGKRLVPLIDALGDWWEEVSARGDPETGAASTDAAAWQM